MPSIELPTILTVDQGVAVAKYLRGQGPKPSGLPAGYILPNGEPANPEPATAPNFSVTPASGKPFPWGWVAAGIVGLGLVVLVMGRRR